MKNRGGDRVRVAQTRYAKGGRLTPWSRASVPAPWPLGGRRQPIVPLVSSGVAGPLALIHLPRMWLEGILDATGRAVAEFATGEPLCDALVRDGIGLDAAAMSDRLRATPVPTYPAFEAWVSGRARRCDTVTRA